MSKKPIDYVADIRKVIRECHEETGVMMTSMEVSWMGDTYQTQDIPEPYTAFTLVDVEVISKLGKAAPAINT